MIDQAAEVDWYAVLDRYLSLWDQLELLQEELHAARQAEDAGAIARTHAAIDQVDSEYQEHRQRWLFPNNPRVSWPQFFDDTLRAT